jgi:hypothetical protein
MNCHPPFTREYKSKRRVSVRGVNAEMIVFDESKATLLSRRDTHNFIL